MADHSKIEWTEATWNPVTGCTKVSEGCDNCYAETFAERWRGTPGHPYEHGFDLTLRPDRLAQALRWTRPRRIFVNSMSDLFHAGIDDAYLAQAFAVMVLARQHTFQVLTKRHARMRALLSSAAFRVRILDAAYLMVTGEDPLITVPKAAAAAYWQQRAVTGDADTALTFPLPNLWLGVSVETQQWANIRIPALLDTPAAVRWISAEPLLGPIDLHWCDGVDAIEQDWAGGQGGGTGAPHPFLGWVVAGGESGPGARPMHPDWARSLRDQCASAEVPFLFKQWGEWSPVRTPGQSNRSRFIGPNGERYDERHPVMDPSWARMYRVGKKAAGRELDGRTWDQYPQVSGAVTA